jgi:hypothetical protein
MLWRGTIHVEWSERIIWGAKLCFNLKIFQKTKFSEQGKRGWLDSNLFHSSTTQDGMVDTSKFTSVGEAWNKVISLPVNSSVPWRRLSTRIPKLLCNIFLYCRLTCIAMIELGGPSCNFLKQMNRDVEKDQVWSYQDKKEDGVDAGFSDCDQMSSAGGKKTIGPK